MTYLKAVQNLLQEGGIDAFIVGMCFLNSHRHMGLMYDLIQVPVTHTNRSMFVTMT